MSPAYNQNVVRIDVFWFARNAGSPAKTFYPQFWQLLKPFGFRAHWGKFCHRPIQRPAVNICGSNTRGLMIS